MIRVTFIIDNHDVTAVAEVQKIIEVRRCSVHLKDTNGGYRTWNLSDCLIRQDAHHKATTEGVVIDYKTVYPDIEATLVFMVPSQWKLEGIEGENLRMKQALSITNIIACNGCYRSLVRMHIHCRNRFDQRRKPSALKRYRAHGLTATSLLGSCNVQSDTVVKDFQSMLEIANEMGTKIIFVSVHAGEATETLYMTVSAPSVKMLRHSALKSV